MLLHVPNRNFLILNNCKKSKLSRFSVPATGWTFQLWALGWGRNKNANRLGLAFLSCRYVRVIVLR